MAVRTAAVRYRENKTQEGVTSELCVRTSLFPSLLHDEASGSERRSSVRLTTVPNANYTTSLFLPSHQLKLTAFSSHDQQVVDRIQLTRRITVRNSATHRLSRLVEAQ